jgi:hypothetical protein
MSDEAKADALEHYLIESLNDTAYLDSPGYVEEQATFLQSSTPVTRRGTGAIFGDGHRDPPALAPMPERPTLVDFFLLRMSMPTVRHLLQSATDAMKTDASEEQILACLLHDLGQAVMKVDHGWWGAQMVEPYVSEKVAWAIRYHQALRFFPDESVGYTYPELYVTSTARTTCPNRTFGRPTSTPASTAGTWRPAWSPCTTCTPSTRTPRSHSTPSSTSSAATSGNLKKASASTAHPSRTCGGR